MISKVQAPYDPRDAEQLVQSLLARRPGYLPSAQEPFEKGPGRALARVVARYLQTIIQRFNQAPEKNKLAFLDTLGLELVPAQAARAPVVFQMSAPAANSRATQRTQVAAPPPPEATGQLIFETERAIGLASAKLTEVVSLWPGRDQYINHSAAFLAGKPFQLFQKLQLENTPHVIYLAHDTLLAFAGESQIDVQFELMQPGGEPLEIRWEYWDGEVWRRFKTVNAACLESEEEELDGTGGLTRTGTVHLQTDCAETAKRKINGREGFWIRGRLTEQLLPASQKKLLSENKLPCCNSLIGPDRMLLPLVESLQIGATINRPLKASLIGSVEPLERSSTPGTLVKVNNEAGQPLNDGDANTPPQVTSVTLTGQSGTSLLTPDAAENYPFSPSVVGSGPYEVRVRYSKLDLSVKQAFDPANDQNIVVALNVEGLTPDAAFADGASLDLSKPFFPFGQQPQPGSIFYFHHKELFTKPNAKARIYISRTKSPQDELQVAVPSTTSGAPPKTVSVPLSRLVAWEYWNGHQWAPLSVSHPSADFDQTEIVDLIVPTDMVKIKINEQEELWARVRLVSGCFAFKQTVTWFDTAAQASNTLTYVVHKPPVVSKFLIGYVWQQGPEAAQQVLTYNDFQYEDHTFEARWPGKNFLPFRQLADTTPALYLGFSKQLPVDRLGVYLEITERPGETLGPALLWEYWDGSEWRSIFVEDETRHLRLPGILSFIGAEDSQPLSRFAGELHWMRGRLKEDGPPGEPIVEGIFPNAVWAAQQQTFNDVALGAGTGLPDQIFTIPQIPINPGERIEVRELSGPRANVEWRIVALELNHGSQQVISELEQLLGREELQGDIVKDDLRLTRDRNKRVTEVWVRWDEAPHLFFSQANDRHYVIDRARGRVYFGDGFRGRIPPPGALILARQFQAGGGVAGNVRARAISQLLGSVPGVEAVFNPVGAEGGADGETMQAFGVRAPQSIRHRGRAIAPADFETLAHEASADIDVARALPTRNASGRVVPGWVTIIIIPQSKERRPWPSFGLRQKVLKFIGARGCADVVAADHIYVTGPDYLPIDVEATIAPLDPAQAGEVEDRAKAALEDFLHPLRGGPNHSGWELGRDVHLSDLAAVVERVQGVDYVEELALLLERTPQGERVAVPDNRIAVAGELRVKIKAGEK